MPAAGASAAAAATAFLEQRRIPPTRLRAAAFARLGSESSIAQFRVRKMS
jgi:hypothetical protein